MTLLLSIISSQGNTVRMILTLTDGPDRSVNINYSFSWIKMMF